MCPDAFSGVQFDSGYTIHALNKVRNAVTSGHRVQQWVLDLHYQIQEALASQIDKLGIDFEDEDYRARCKRVSYSDRPDILEDYYHDDTLLVRVRRPTLAQNPPQFIIEVPKYGD